MGEKQKMITSAVGINHFGWTPRFTSGQVGNRRNQIFCFFCFLVCFFFQEKAFDYYRDVKILVVTGNEFAPESHDGVCFVFVSTDQVVILLGIQ